jgi:hypothetical protein
METTYDVRIWSIQANARARGKTYVVRWKVGSRRWKTTFKTAALADSFRSDLLSAARKGEAFSTPAPVGRCPCSGPAQACPGTPSPARTST